jgi:thiol-disulfide isomerase/thioredoxin
MRVSVIVAGLLFLAIVANPRSRGQEPGVDLREVKYDGLKEAVRKHRGKVVVVDFWSTTCVPCLREFPHILEMQRKYAARGLETISVSTDPIEEGKTDKERREKVLDRLRKLDARITNLLLEDSSNVLEKKLRIQTIPSIYVFNRAGKWVQFGGTPEAGVEAAAVEKLVVKLLDEKQEDVSLRPVKHSELLKEIAAQRGKVVVIDFWGEF